MEIDPEALSAAGELCTRQQSHVQDMSSYLEGVLDRPEAFSGVLTVFAGSYAGAVAAGRRGLADSARAAGLMGHGMRRLRAEVLATDDEVARRLDRTRPAGRYAAAPVGSPVGAVGAGPARTPLPLGVPPGDGAGNAGGSSEDGGVGAGEHRVARWEQRSDAAADRWRAQWDEDAGRPADPARYEAERGARRRARDLLGLALAPDQVLRDVRAGVDALGDSVRATADALGDVRERRAFVAGAGSTPAAGEVARGARGWWR